MLWSSLRLACLIGVLAISFAPQASADVAEAYRVVEDWPQLPSDLELGEVAGVAVDSHNHVFIFHRGDEKSILCVEAGTGALVHSFGGGMFKNAHGLAVDQEDNVWVTDTQRHQVFKFSHDGALLMTVGEEGVSGDDESHFNQPTDVVVTRQGDFFVSDGYGNSRIVKFDARGEFLFAKGTKGSRPRQFDLPHGIAIDSQGRIYVADRSNMRIQVFDTNGNFVREWKSEQLGEVGRPWGLEVGPDELLYVIDGGDMNPDTDDHAQLIKMDLQGNVLARWSSYGTAPGQLSWGHDVAVGADGAIYTAEVRNNNRAQKFVPMSASERQSARRESVTFASHVAPIFQRSCQQCHRPGQIAPMSLLSYEEARPWAKSIKQRVAKREMPPWHADPKVGLPYAGDVSLSDDEIETIVGWVDAGAPRGNPRDLPAPVAFPADDEWGIGEPDLILTMAEEYVVPAEGPDQFVNFYLPTGLTEDRYIKAVEIMPSRAGRENIHHVMAYAIQDEEDYVGVEVDDRPRTRADGSRTGTIIMEYAVGNRGDVFPEGTGRPLRAGADVRFGIHYHSRGEVVRDRTSIGFVFYPKGVIPKHRIISTRIMTTNLDIPAGAENVRHDAYFRLKQPAKVINFQPHMHYRGKSMYLEAIRLNGRPEILCSVPAYDFYWQITYPFAEPPVYPAGTLLHVVSYHDNSADNPDNPDPGLWVGWGANTTDEMAIGWTDFIYISDEEYETILAARDADNQKRHRLAID